MDSRQTAKTIFLAFPDKLSGLSEPLWKSAPRTTATHEWTTLRFLMSAVFLPCFLLSFMYYGVLFFLANSLTATPHWLKDNKMKILKIYIPASLYLCRNHLLIRHLIVTYHCFEPCLYLLIKRNMFSLGIWGKLWVLSTAQLMEENCLLTFKN